MTTTEISPARPRPSGDDDADRGPRSGGRRLLQDGAAWLADRPVLVTAVAVTVLLHGALLALGTWRGTYDAYVHLFFADHYQRDWFSTWDTRWYTGFPVTSYPPGAHMALALVGTALPTSVAYPLVQTLVLVLLTVGVYRAAKVWVGDRPAQWAALLAATSPALGEVVHVFGQLPTTFGLAFTLNALPFAHRWVRHGRRRDLVLALSCAAAATSAHHVTTLFGSVFFVGPVLLRGVLDERRAAQPDEATGHRQRLSGSTLLSAVARRLRRVHRPLARVVVFGLTLGVVLVAVVLPYWLWSSSDPIVQIPIPHASRENFLQDANAGLVFWLVPWGPMIVALPAALRRGLRERAWPLVLSVALLTVLGLGGTTPIARALLGRAFDILTFDRFTIWATVAVLPLMGVLLVELVERRRWLGVGAVTAAVIAALTFSVSLTAFRPFQPDPIDPAPIVEFLAKDDHDNWRYLPLGFGDQMAWVSAQTTATTVDGNYHSARRLPQLTSRAVERLEGAKYRGVPGLGSLQQFLVTPEAVNLAYVLSADAFYDPLLHFTGWQHLGALENGVEVWERPDVPPLPEVLPRRELPSWQRLHWGVVPPAALLIGLLILPLSTLVPRAPARPPRGLVRRLDRWLAERAVAAGGPSPPAGWTRRLPTRRLSAARREVARQSVRRAAAALLITLAVAAVVAGAGGARREPGPGAVVINYLEALDERRAEDARALIHPDVRPTADAYRLIRSVDGGGLRDSYARLDDAIIAEVDLATADATSGVVVVEASFLTPLNQDLRRITMAVRQDGGAWFVIPQPRDASSAPEQLTVLPSAEWLQVGRSQITTTRTVNADVLDRPELRVTSARLLEVDGRYVIVGEVVNVDADPASVVLTGQLQDDEGGLLVEWNAGQAAARTLLPGEAAPFRIDFEGIAGAASAEALAAPDFSPDGWTPPTLPPDAVVAAADLYARAVVTTRGLERPLAHQDVTASAVDGRIVVAGHLRNVGLVEASVPQVLVAVLDDDGGVLWTEMTYLEEAIRPQLDAPFSVTLPPLEAIAADAATSAVETFANGLPAERTRSTLHRTAVPVTGMPGVSAVAVVPRAFVRTP